MPSSRRSFRARPFALVASALAATCFVAAGSAAGQTVLAQSHFDSSLEGWSIVTTATGTPLIPVATFTPDFVNAGGNPGGYARISDPDSNDSYWVAPAAFLGNKSAAYGGTLTFDLEESFTSNPFSQPDVIIIGGGLTLSLAMTEYPATSWSSYAFLLNEHGGWHIDTPTGALATAAQVQQVLANITNLYIRAEYQVGADVDGLDNVAIQTHATTLPSSTFDTDTEGWWFENDGNPPVWHATGGNPGGYISVQDVGDGRLWSYVAPIKFLGDLSAARHLHFDQKVSANEIVSADSTVTIVSDSLTIEFVAASDPSTTAWTSYDIDLAPGPGWTTLPGNTPTTAADFAAALSNVTRFVIRGEWSATVDTGQLDNVIFTGESGPHACNVADIVSVGQQPPPDGLLTGDDYVAFINAFFTGSHLADIVGVGQQPPPDGLLTGDDYVAFINAFFVGCAR